jgi:hypothetical protein
MRQAVCDMYSNLTWFTLADLSQLPAFLDSTRNRSGRARTMVESDQQGHLLYHRRRRHHPLPAQISERQTCLGVHNQSLVVSASQVAPSRTLEVAELLLHARDIDTALAKLKR